MTDHPSGDVWDQPETRPMLKIKVVQLVLQWLGMMAILLVLVRYGGLPNWTVPIATLIATMLVPALLWLELVLRLTSLDRNITEAEQRWAAEDDTEEPLAAQGEDSELCGEPLSSQEIAARIIAFPTPHSLTRSKAMVMMTVVQWLLQWAGMLAILLFFADYAGLPGWTNLVALLLAALPPALLQRMHLKIQHRRTEREIAALVEQLNTRSPRESGEK